MAQKILTGKIVSNKMQGTVVVAVEIPKKHKFYGKPVKNTRRFKARNVLEAKLDDTVVIKGCRPYSKEVTWEVVEIKE
jgi:small subunit ribosomal protein S17